MRLLLLAGTSEARQLAAILAAEGFPAIASLAGATRTPAPLALPTRHAGFGGMEGFEAFVVDQRIGAVIDATHPFAARITQRTHDVCVRMGVPLLRLERPAWVPRDGDRWTYLGDEAQGIERIPEAAVVFLATGRQSLSAWTGLRAGQVYLRVIDRPAEPFPLPGSFVTGRPPFDLAAETELFERLGVTHLVAKDSGSAEARPKLEAARNLGIEVLILGRPARPSSLLVVETVEQAADWARRLPFRSG
ncbi:cobalt-precorrin-6A reductase [Rubellimicrobium rubrum]|uniref:Cobalt-precorrin-6A reductase n=1 Tax=Rubellimicrobium rubrum TaxID=2585369 RepID=A0A5C4MZT7_9RHOB|nr:cobalt-precorrin-6A reductase [Rubellimicrobium rubrum]TNC50450.1 cobalt-precorrin-6A reductase [Rubellimicrobium rubrum]